MPGRGKLLFFSILAISASVLFAQDAGSERINYADYFTMPETDKDIIFVFYNNYIDKSDQNQFAYALMYGLEYTYGSSLQGKTLSVGIYFSNGSGKIYLVPKNVYASFRNKSITSDQLFAAMTIRDVKL
ncbi:MAG: hypothetical protein EHM28_00935 [Spirochaetaceae bacterium]|nr:MAG: hypothetical protein EHM28_00935 [Spirochaetaceae bacterium]